MKTRLETKVAELLEEMLEATEAERLEALDKIKSNFCDGCGCRQDAVARTCGGMRCQCENDE